jgi:hypothetical protein
VEAPRLASFANALVGIALSAAITWAVSKGFKL